MTARTSVSTVGWTMSNRDSSEDPFMIHETVAFSVCLIFALFLLERCGL